MNMYKQVCGVLVLISLACAEERGYILRNYMHCKESDGTLVLQSIDYNHEHCGSCYTQCASNETCCYVSTRMGGICTDLHYDNFHCGTCHTRCPPQTLCFHGECTKLFTKNMLVNCDENKDTCLISKRLVESKYCSLRRISQYDAQNEELCNHKISIECN